MEPTANVKKAERPRFWVAFLFRDLAAGETFKPDVLHLTVIPWFVTEVTQEQVIKAFVNKFTRLKQFEITIGETGEFKSRRRISVNFVAPSPWITDIHARALDWLAELQGRWAVKTPHVGDDYIPHIRRRKGHNFSEFEKVRLTGLSLVSAFRRGDDQRTVIARVGFDEK